MTFPTPEQRAAIRALSEDEHFVYAGADLLALLEWGEALEAEVAALRAEAKAQRRAAKDAREQVSVLREERDNAVAALRQVLEANVFPEDTVL